MNRCENCGLSLVRSDFRCPLCGTPRLRVEIGEENGRLVIKFVDRYGETINLGPILVSIDNKQMVLNYPYTFFPTKKRFYIKVLVRGGNAYSRSYALKHWLELKSIGKEAKFKKVHSSVKIHVPIDYEGFLNHKLHIKPKEVQLYRDSESINISINEIFINPHKYVIEIDLDYNDLYMAFMKGYQNLRISFYYDEDEHTIDLKIPYEIFGYFEISKEIYNEFWRYFDGLDYIMPYFLPLLRNRPVVAIYNVPPGFSGRLYVLERLKDGGVKRYLANIVGKPLIGKFLVIRSKYPAGELDSIKVVDDEENRITMIPVKGVLDDNDRESDTVVLNIDFGTTHIRIYTIGRKGGTVIFEPSWAFRKDVKIYDYISYGLENNPILLTKMDFPREEGLYAIKILLLRKDIRIVKVPSRNGYVKYFMMNKGAFLNDFIKVALDNLLWIAGDPRVIGINISYPSYLSEEDVKQIYERVFNDIAKKLNLGSDSIRYKDEASAVLEYFMIKRSEIFEPYKERGEVKLSIWDVGGGTTDIIVATLRFVRDNYSDDGGLWILDSKEVFGSSDFGGIWLTLLLLHWAYTFVEDVGSIEEEVENRLAILTSKTDIWEYMREIRIGGIRNLEIFEEYIRNNTDENHFVKYQKYLQALKYTPDLWESFGIMENIKLTILQEEADPEIGFLNKVCYTFYNLKVKELKIKLEDKVDWGKLDLVIFAGRASQTDYFKRVMYEVFNIPKEKVLFAEKPEQLVVQGLGIDILEYSHTMHFYYLDNTFKVIDEIEEGRYYRIRYDPIMIYKSPLKLSKGRYVDNVDIFIHKRRNYYYFKIENGILYLFDRNKREVDRIFINNEVLEKEVMEVGYEN